MNKKSLLAFVCLFAFLSLTISPAFATDARYHDWKYMASGGSISGNVWSWYPTDYTHSGKKNYQFYNDFPEDYGVAFGHIWMYTSFNPNMDYIGKSDGKEVEIKLFINGQSDGVILYINFTSPSRNMFIWEKRWNGEILNGPWEVNGDDYKLLWEVKSRMSPVRVGNERTYSFSYHLYKWRKSDGQITGIMGTRAFNRKSNIYDSAYYSVKVSADYGTFGCQGVPFSCTSSVYDIGKNCDISQMDFCVDMYDAIVLSQHFGIKAWESSGIPYWDTTQAWKADLNADGSVDIFDSIILSNYFD